MSTECGSLYQFLRKWGSKGQTWAVSLPGEHKSWRGKAKDLQGAHETFELTWLQLWRFTQVSVTSTVASPPSPSAPPPPSAPPTSPGWGLAGLWGVRGTFGGRGRGGGGRLGGGCCWRLWLELWVGACRHCKTEHTSEQKDEKCYHLTAHYYYTVPAGPTVSCVSSFTGDEKLHVQRIPCVHTTKSTWQARMLLYCDQWQSSVMFHHCSRFLGLSNRTFIMEI